MSLAYGVLRDGPLICELGPVPSHGLAVSELEVVIHPNEVAGAVVNVFVVRLAVKLWFWWLFT